MGLRAQQSKTLAEYVAAVMDEKGLNSNQIAERSNNLIEASYVRKIRSGEVTNISSDKLIALANGLGVRTKDLIARAFDLPIEERELAESRFYEFMREFEKLDKEGQRDFLRSVEALLVGYRQRA